MELTFESARDHAPSTCDIDVISVFSGPAGQEVSVRAFWDGGNTWRVRFCPDEAGVWRWRTAGSNTDDPGLHGREGLFDCAAYEGDNPLYRHGALRLSNDCHRLVHGDGTPFFWLSDTAWNGVIRGDDENWRTYLDARKRQRFTAIQFVCCTWRGDVLDEAGEDAFTGAEAIRINPRFFQRIDRRVAMINEYGLVAVPVILWSRFDNDVGNRLSETDAANLASYIMARYDAHQVVWILGGDGKYETAGIERWKRIGRAVFGAGHNRLGTLHPSGVTWIGEEFRSEDWYDIIGYQSGHGDNDEDLEWLVKGPPACNWDHKPPLPVLNLEPNYEDAAGYHHGTVFTGYHVRRAAYWSLCISPTAGVTYGHDAIWNWNYETGPSEGHGELHGGSVPPWQTGIDTEGIRSMMVMRGIMERLDWSSLTPAQPVLRSQPGDASVSSFVAAARGSDGTLVVYTPCGGTVGLATDAVVEGPVRIVDPRTGEVRVAADTALLELQAPDTQDWLFVCGPGWVHPASSIRGLA